MPRDVGDERRTLKELTLRYELHPNLIDVYVEGETDKAVIEWFLTEHDRRDWYVYSIDTVEVPAELVRARGLDVKNRNEVLTLGMELSERLPDVLGRKPVCIADRDDESSDDPNIDCALCLLTDFADMEVYAFNVKTLRKFLRVFARVQSLDAETLLKSITTTLVDLFVVRRVFYRWKNGIGVYGEFTRCCAKGRTGVVLDVTDLVTRSLESTARRFRPPIPGVLEEVKEQGTRISSDVRFAIRGHDFVNLLSWYLDGFGVPLEFRNKAVVERALFASLEVSDLVEYPMFAELLNRTAS